MIYDSRPFGRKEIEKKKRREGRREGGKEKEERKGFARKKGCGGVIDAICRSVSTVLGG